MTMDHHSLERAVDTHLSETGLLIPDPADAHEVWLALSGNLTSAQAEDRLPTYLYNHWLAVHEGVFEALPGEDRREVGRMKLGITKGLLAAAAAAEAVWREVDYDDYGETTRHRVTMEDIRRVLSVDGVSGFATGASRNRLRTIYGVLPPPTTFRVITPGDDFMT